MFCSSTASKPIWSNFLMQDEAILGIMTAEQQAAWRRLSCLHRDKLQGSFTSTFNMRSSLFKGQNHYLQTLHFLLSSVHTALYFWCLITNVRSSLLLIFIFQAHHADHYNWIQINFCDMLPKKQSSNTNVQFGSIQSKVLLHVQGAARWEL